MRLDVDKKCDKAKIPEDMIFEDHISSDAFRVFCYLCTLEKNETIHTENIRLNLNWETSRVQSCLAELIEYRIIVSD